MFRVFLFTVLQLVLASSLASSGKYNVEGVYAEKRESGIYAKISLGQIEEVEALYIKTKIDAGNYSINVTRKGKDWYEIDGYGLFIHTRYCYEYSYGKV